MSCAKYMFIASVVATAATLAGGANEQALISDVAKNAMCPIKVEVNDNPDRVPRNINYYKCDSSPNAYCAEKKLTDGCCQKNHDGLTTQCVELYDYVEVKYNNAPESDTIKVPVGCTCVIGEITRPGEVS